LSREVFSFELIDNGSTTVYIANGENPWFDDLDDFDDFDWDLYEMGEYEGSGADVNAAEGDDEDEDDYEFYDPPIKLNLLKGTLHVEEVNSLLPASEGRVAKQLEATNLTQGADGKYTTTVKMTLPVNEGVDPEDYYLKHDLGKGEFDEENNYDDDYGDDDYDDYDVDYDWPSGAAGSGGAAVAREDGRHRNPARMSKQNDTLYEETTVAFKLSPKFKLALTGDEVGTLDISKFKLVDYEYVYVPEGRKFEDTEYYEKNYEQFDEDYVKEVFNGQKPERDEETGFISKDFKAYQVDPGEVVEELPEGTQVFGFGLIKRSDDEDDDEVDANSEGREGEEESGETYGMGDFLYLVFYMPEGMPDVVAESEPDDTEKTSAGEEFDIFSYLDEPTLIVQYFGDIKKDYTVNLLNPLHYFTFEFEEELADPSTTPGTYGTYDPLGDRDGAVDGATIKVLDGAVLVRDGLRQGSEPEEEYRNMVSAASEDYGFEKERPEEFYIPTVSYTVNGGGNNNTGGGGRSGGRATVTVPEPEVPLAETPELNKADHVAYVIGYEDGTVRPENKITRAEVATIFFRLLTDESRKAIWSSSNSYKDTAAGAWYNNAVSTLSNGGVLSGYTDGTFLPSGNITRAEFATIAARFDESDVSTANISFTDIGGHWAENYIRRAAALGYITGYQDGSFKPDAPITRAEAMTLLNRVLGRDKISASGLLDNMARWSDNPVGAWYYVAVQEATNTHDYTIEDGVETWTGILPDRDWAALEKEWASGAF
ncbi:MAG: S-layer homology domain-containing protein, partial [Clostridia bacterium]|nr:S-layer homology domain-containing protein [Clostridia bacterium]